MKTHATSPLQCLPLTKAGMAIAALCLAGQVLAQAAPNAPANGGSTADPVRPADDHAKHSHREAQPAPVKPQHYPSTPQPPVPTRR
ncbi:hypothetical protein [Polaromonas naphthalenivorans]|nr:hypothetical protein [Polaromonas naphthalenivorans]